MSLTKNNYGANKVITFDGPAGTGKSTVASIVAEKLGYIHADSGAIYRTITLALMERLGPSSDPEEFGKKMVESKIPFEALRCSVTLRDLHQVNRIDGRDVGEKIRVPELTARIKYIADTRRYRDAVNDQLRLLSKKISLVVDGRDAGTVIFPDASIKFYLDASPSVRAERRLLDLKQKGIAVSDGVAEIEADIRRRDMEDENREFGALKKAADAIIIDTSMLEIKDVVALTMSYLQLRF